MASADEVRDRSAAVPEEFHPHRLRRRAVPVLVAIAALVLVALLAPGLGDVRHHLSSASPEWIALAVVLEALSCASYVLMFRPIFCTRTLSWKTSRRIGLSELAVGSLVPASGMGGLALGAWILNRDGMPGRRIAQRSVAFFLIKSSVNFVAVAVIGLAMAVGLFGPHVSLGLTLVPALMSIALIAAVLGIPRLGEGREPGPSVGRVGRWLHSGRSALIDGTAGAIEIVRERNALVIVGAVGYWVFDNAVLWATFHALGHTPPLSILLMGYLIGQMGGLLPLPGGVGGIDGGLIGTLVVFGAPAAATAAAVLAYRLILFWLPLVLGVPEFAALWREMEHEPEPEAATV